MSRGLTLIGAIPRAILSRANGPLYGESGPLRGIKMIPLSFLALHQTGQGSGLCNVHAPAHKGLEGTSAAS